MKKKQLPTIIMGIITYALIGIFVIMIVKTTQNTTYKTETYSSTKGSFTVETSDIVIEPGESHSVKINDKSNDRLIWSSEDETIAKVDSNNKIIGVSPGTTKIIIQKEENDYVVLDVTIKEQDTKNQNIKDNSNNNKDNSNNNKDNSKNNNNNKDNNTKKPDSTPKSTSTVPTKKPSSVKEVKTISLSTSSLNLGTGSSSSTTVTATISPSDASNKTITWTSSNNDVATVSNGVVKGKHAGTATITATANNGVKATVNVKVTSTDRIHFIPVKLNNSDTNNKGDAIVLESNGYFAMIDTGDETTSSRKQVLSYLSKLGVKEKGYPLEFVLITHLHGDHYGGFNTLLRHKIKVKTLYMKRYSSSLGKKYSTTYTDIMNCAKGVNTECLPVDQVILTQTKDESGCPDKSNTANSNFSCTYSFTFQKMNIKLYNTAYVMKDGDIGSNGKKYKSKKKSNGVEEIYNANYESIYEYIKVNNHRIVLAADAVGEKPGVTLDAQNHPFTSDQWYKKIKIDAGTGIDILKAPHHGDMNGDKNYSELKPKNVVVTNANRQIVTRSGLTDYENMGARIIYVEYYDKTEDLAGVYADLSTSTISWHRMRVY